MSDLPTPTPLSGTLRRKLKAQAQRMSAGPHMGKAGLSPEFVASVDRELALHELVKVRFTESQAQRYELAEELAQKIQGHVIQVVGHVAVVYRAKPVPAKAEVAKPEV